MSERMTVEWLEETLYLMNHIETDAEHYAKFHREIVVAFSALRASEAALSARVKVLEEAVRWVVTDAKYKAPEQIGIVPERWIDRLKVALAGTPAAEGREARDER